MQKLLAASAALVITIGGVATAISAVWDLGNRLITTTHSDSQVSDGQTPEYTEVREDPNIVPTGVEVVEVIPDSPADRAGVKVGQVIIAIGGKRVENTRDFKSVLSQSQRGETVLLTIRADSTTKHIRTKLAPVEGTNLKLGVIVKNSEPWLAPGGG